MSGEFLIGLRGEARFFLPLGMGEIHEADRLVSGSGHVVGSVRDRGSRRSSKDQRKDSRGIDQASDERSYRRKLRRIEEGSRRREIGLERDHVARGDVERSRPSADG